ncbi:MAG: ribosome biogenesis protein, partial [Thaumarchaeota archaeon]|nr:ribosome biogenesis protein [Nitrososphaerota archaeon]
MKLSLVIAESALELVPEEIKKHPSVVADSKRRGISPTSILLDRSIHHAAMLRLNDGLKRGRPDLVHITLLGVTGAPLYQDELVRVYIHTLDDLVLEIKEGTRPPKSYFRFRSLMEKILLERPKDGLIIAYPSSLPGLVKRLRGDLVVGLSVQGEYKELGNLASELVSKENPVVLIGGFPRGHFV